jgi:predicted permease
MGGWIRHAKLAVRSLARNPGFAVLAIVTLALGIGANTAIFSVIDGALLRPLPYADPDGLVYLSDGHEDFGGAGINQSIPNLLDLRSASRLLSDAAIFTYRNGNLATAERPERVRILRTSHEMLGVLGVTPRLGRDLLLENDLSGSPAVAILTDQTWRARFGADPGIIGRTTTLDAAPVTIIGVLPPDFSFPGVPELIMPLQHVGEDFSRGNRTYNGIGRLVAGAEVEPLRDELQGIFAGIAEQYPGPNDGWYTWADPIRQFAISAGGQSLFLFAGAVGLVLLIACVNVANLLLVRSEGRQQEFALRYSLGASRAALVPLFVSEGLVLSLIGGLAGIVTAKWGIGALVALFGGAIPRADQIHLSGTALAVGVATSLVVGILVGLIPLVRTNPDNALEHLKEGARGSAGRGGRLGSALVMVEVALSVLLVSGAGLLTKSVWKIQDIDLGIMDGDRVLTFMVALPRARYDEDPAKTRFLGDLLQELQRIPGVQSAAAVNRLPLLGGYNTTNFPSVADPERNARFVSMRAVTPDYFKTTGVPLVKGRWLTATEFEDDNSVSILVNETLATQLFPGEDPLGQMVGPGMVDGGLRIVGVVGDIMGGRPTSPPPPAFFYPVIASPSRNISVMVKSAGGDPYPLLPIIRQVVQEIDAEVPIYQIRTLGEIAVARLGTRRVAMSLFGIFAALALLLGAVGIYGVMSFTVAQRSKELGVRLALGASRRSIFRLVFERGARLTLPGIAVGVVLALASARVLSNLLYEVSTLDPITYIAVAGVLVFVAGFASYLPAYRATRVDPLASIRSE